MTKKNFWCRFHAFRVYSRDCNFINWLDDIWNSLGGKSFVHDHESVFTLFISSTSINKYLFQVGLETMAKENVYFDPKCKKLHTLLTNETVDGRIFRLQIENRMSLGTFIKNTIDPVYRVVEQ